MISQENQLSSITEIRFPAVTICPYKKFNIRKKNMTDFILRDRNDSKRTNDDELVYQLFWNTCPSLTFPGLYEDILDPKKYISKMLELKPNYATLFSDYYFWNDHLYKEKLKPILYNKGICYTFNSLATSKIYRNESNPHKYLLDNFKYNNDDNKSYIKSKESNILYKGKDSGKRSGLKISILNRKSDNWELCQSNRQGAEIMIHSPDEIPNFKNSILISGKEDVSVSITPRVINISDELKSVHISKRQCYLENEKYLQHFKIYTQSNCELECIANITLILRECVEFYMPRNKTTKVCGRFRMFFGLLNFISIADTKKKCQCLPSCSSISYNTEISLTEPFIGTDESNTNIDNIATLKFYFKESKFVSWKRYESYGTNDFLASIGGIFGLFLGISIMSISEIVYFFTIRLYTHYFGRRNRS